MVPTAGSPAAIWVLNAGNLANTATGAQTIGLGALLSSGTTGGQLGNNAAGSAVIYSISGFGLEYNL